MSTPQRRRRPRRPLAQVHRSNIAPQLKPPTPEPPKPPARTQVVTKPKSPARAVVLPEHVRTFTNEYLSVSRIRKYAQCPQSFRFSYIDKLPRGTNDNLAFGSLVHLTLEAINRWATKQEFVGTVPDEVIVDGFRAAWKACEIDAEDLYQEGLDVLREWFRANPEIDSRLVLGIEEKFEFDYEGRHFLGFIDRVDKIADDAVLVRDYKTNRILFTQDETQDDVQLSVYAHAARSLYPWAKRVELAFDMVRHGRTLRTTRDDPATVDALHYCIDTADKSEHDTLYAPRLHVYCAWCDHLDKCEAFAQALTDKQEFVAITQDDELETIAKERERLVLIGKAVEGKRKALDRLITSLLKAGDTPSVTAGGVTYRLGSKSNRSYETKATLAKLVQFGGITQDQASQVLSIGATALDTFVKGLGLSRPMGKILKANLDSVCVRTPGSRYLEAKPVKGTKK